MGSEGSNLDARVTPISGFGLFLSMISYELAKELKDAGFPQEGINKERGFSLDTFEPIMLPTLSELIEACGSRFIQLTRTRDGEWIAAGQITGESINTPKALGGEFENTPLEAVAKLWLAFNKKS